MDLRAWGALAFPILGAMAPWSLAAEPFGERRIAVVPEDLAFEGTSITGPDGRTYTPRSRFAFGANGGFVAYVAYREGASVAVVDDRVLGEFDYLDEPVLDPNGEHYAFRAGRRVERDREQWWAIVDGEKGATYDWIGALALGSDGAAAFWEQPGARIAADGSYRNGKMVFHFGRRDGKPMDSALSLLRPAVSADGARVATVGVRANEHVAVVASARKHEIAREGFPMVEGFAISRDGKRVALCVVVGGAPLPPGMPPMPGMSAGHRRIHDGKRDLGEAFDEAFGPVFRPDGKKLAYRFVSGGRMGIAIDDREVTEERSEFLGEPVFAEDGRSLVWFSCDGGELDAFERLQPWAAERIIGGRYAIHRRSSDGCARIADDLDGVAHLTFGPKDALAFAARDSDGWRVIAGETTSDAFDEVGPPVFAADGSRVAFGARSGRELWWRVLEIE